MEERDYTRIIEREEQSVGFLQGSDRLLYVKGGAGGTIYGYENKYLELAFRIREKYGFSVMVSATSSNKLTDFLRDIELAVELLGKRDFKAVMMGVSMGGLMGIWYGAEQEQIERIAAINPPLMLNYYNKTLPGMKKLGRDRLTMVFGTLDPSYKYLPFAERHAAVKLIEGADHNLRGSRLSLFDLAEELLINEQR